MINNKLKPIETNYNGYRFRSRLEARWAIYFDIIKAKWEYEIEGFNLDKYGYYLPDFYFPEENLWAEVKPTQLNDIELQKVKELSLESEMDVLLLVGVPEVKSYDAVSNGEIRWVGYILSYNHMHGGFYDCCLGCPDYHLDPKRYNNFWLEEFKDAYKAVDSAKSARFEYGESGR